MSESKFNLFRLLSISLTCMDCARAMRSIEPLKDKTPVTQDEVNAAEYMRLECPHCHKQVRIRVHLTDLSEERR